MKKDILIDTLSRGAGPVPRALVARRLAPPIAIGLVGSIALAMIVLGPLPSIMFLTPAPWIKVIYALCLAAAAQLLTARLSRPIARLHTPRILVVMVIAVMEIVGIITLVLTPE